MNVFAAVVVAAIFAVVVVDVVYAVVVVDVVFCSLTMTNFWVLTHLF